MKEVEQRPRGEDGHGLSRFLPLSIVLLAAGLRFNQATMPLRADEAANYYLAIKPPQEIIQPLVTGDPHLPLFYFLLHYWIGLAGPSELALRYLTIFAAVLVVPLVYLLGKLLFPGTNAPLIAALLMAINPYSIWDSQDAYMYAMLTATGLASFIVFIRLFRPGASWGQWLAYIVLSALALYEHYLAGLILVAQGSVWLWSTARRSINWRSSALWLAAQIAILALFAPWLFVAFPLLSGLSYAVWKPVGLFELVARSLVAFSLGRVSGLGMPAMTDPLVGILGLVPFLILVIVGMVVPGIREGAKLQVRAVLTIWLWIPLIAFFLFTLVRFPIYDERYVLFLIPPFLMLVSRGLVVLHQRSKSTSLVTATLLLLVILDSRSLYNYWYVPAYAKSPDWPGFVGRLTAEYRQGDVFIQNYPDPALPYYLRERVPSFLVPGRSPPDKPSVNDRLEQLSAKYGRIWFQPVAGNQWDTESLVGSWLDSHAVLVREYSFRGLQLDLYQITFSALERPQFQKHYFLSAFGDIILPESIVSSANRGPAPTFARFRGRTEWQLCI